MASTTGAKSDSSLSLDPFAAPGVQAVIDTNAVQSDLPPQARQARDRPLPRSSVRNQMLASLIIPYVLVAVGAIAFMFYQLPQIYREELGRRAYQAALDRADARAEIINQLPEPSSLQALRQLAKQDLVQMPEAVAVLYAAPVMKISGTDGELAAFESRLKITSPEAQALDAQFTDLVALNKNFGAITFRGETYVASYATVKATNKTDGSVGDVHVLYSLAEIPARVLQSIVPLLVALGIIFIFALFLANALAARLSRPIIAATQQANRIALGDLDRSVTVESNDEISDMLNSLERMRVSLKSMVARMRRNS